METLLFEVRPTDPATLLSVAATITFVAAVACLVPALRATRVNPRVVMRAVLIYETPSSGSWWWSVTLRSNAGAQHLLLVPPGQQIPELVADLVGKAIRGDLPTIVCSGCKRVRLKDGRWHVRTLPKNSHVTHGFAPSACAACILHCRAVPVSRVSVVGSDCTAVLGGRIMSMIRALTRRGCSGIRTPVADPPDPPRRSSKKDTRRWCRARLAGNTFGAGRSSPASSPTTSRRAPSATANSAIASARCSAEAVSAARARRRAASRRR